MKTIRILLLPDESQMALMEMCITTYSSLLIQHVIEGRSDLIADVTSDFFCASTQLQLWRDICRRIQRFPKRHKLAQLYCRWGNDYQLTQDKVCLPLGAGSIINELNINCIYRTFQTKLLGAKHPATLTLKRIKGHWYAYLLVAEDK